MNLYGKGLADFFKDFFYWQMDKCLEYTLWVIDF